MNVTWVSRTSAGLSSSLLFSGILLLDFELLPEQQTLVFNLTVGIVESIVELVDLVLGGVESSLGIVSLFFEVFVSFFEFADSCLVLFAFFGSFKSLVASPCWAGGIVMS